MKMVVFDTLRRVTARCSRRHLIAHVPASRRINELSGKVMSAEFKDFYQAMRDYIQAAMQLLSEVCPERPPHVLVGLEEWKRHPDGLFRRGDREEPFWVECLFANLDRLHALGEYSRLVTTLRGIPHIARQLGNAVGTALESSGIDADSVTDYIVWRLPRTSGKLRFDEHQFDNIFHELEASLRQTSISFVVLAPLEGLRLGSAPIPLGPDVEIDKMTDEEIVRCLALGLLSGPFGPRPMIDIKSHAAVRVRFRMEKKVGLEPPPSLEEAFRVQRAAFQRAMTVLHALRIFKDGRVSVPALLRFSPDWPVQDSTYWEYSNPGPRPWANDYALSSGETHEFSELWRHFEEVTAKGVLANAVRRFSYASDRARDDDSLVDLMIAAESIFLADVARPEDRGELRYRLALRAAFFIESPEFSRREIFKHMKRAYDVRSAIVHGGSEPDPNLLKSPKGAALSLQDFTKLTEHLLRVALKKRIEMVKTAGSSTIDWEDLIIPP
jgi:hypothetical protein